MNCKPGDLAMFINCDLEQINGFIVRIKNQPPLPGLLWELDEPVNIICAVDMLHPKHGFISRGTEMTVRRAPDDLLRPIRDGGGQDETLVWAGKPPETKSFKQLEHKCKPL